MLAYFAVRYVRSAYDLAPDFVRYYLTDLMFVPTMGIFALIVVRYLKRDSTIRIPAFVVFVQVVLVSMFFEWYLPNYSGKVGWYTADMVDVLMYFFGGFIFLFAQKRI